MADALFGILDDDDGLRNGWPHYKGLLAAVQSGVSTDASAVSILSKAMITTNT